WRAGAAGLLPVAPPAGHFARVDRVVGAVVLPLREDLRLHEAGPARDGAPAWVIQDPVSNRFYRIGWLEYECLLRWPGDPARIAAEISASTPLAVDTELVQEFAGFLEQNRLLRPGAEGLGRLKQQAI